MEFKELKKDMLIHWVANRVFKSWDTLGKVVKLTKTQVTILTFDDFKETTLEKNGGEALSREIKSITKETALNIIESECLEVKDKINRFKQRKTILERAISEIKKSTCQPVN